MIMLFLMSMFNIHNTNTSEYSVPAHHQVQDLQYKEYFHNEITQLKNQICVNEYHLDIISCKRGELKNLDIQFSSNKDFVLFKESENLLCSRTATFNQKDTNDLIFKYSATLKDASHYTSWNIINQHDKHIIFDTGRIVHADRLLMHPSITTIFYALFFGSAENPNFKKLQIRKYLLDENSAIKGSKALFKVEAADVYFNNIQIDPTTQKLHLIYLKNNCVHQYMYNTETEEHQNVTYAPDIEKIVYCLGGKEVQFYQNHNHTEHIMKIQGTSEYDYITHRLKFDLKKNLMISPDGKIGATYNKDTGKAFFMDLSKFIVIGLFSPQETFCKADKWEFCYQDNLFWIEINKKKYVVDITPLYKLIEK